MRILFAADVSSDPNSGAAGTEYQTMQALQALGHEVDEIWADDLPRKIRHGNLHYLLELPRGYRNTIRRKWQAGVYDVVHVDQPHAYLAAMDHRKSERHGVFVNRSHGLELRFQEALRPWRKKFGMPEWQFPRGVVGLFLQHLLARHSRLVARYADGTIVYCEECRDFLVTRHGVAPERVAATAAAAPDSFLNSASVPLSPSRSRKLLYVGQFAFFKGPMILATAVNRVMDCDEQCEFTWVCNRADHDVARGLLSANAANRTTFLGWCDQSSLMRIYDEHGIFIFPSLYEGFGKVFLEAMCRGLCVVASNTGGMPDVITDGKDGYLVPAGDADALARGVLELIRNPERAADIGGRARQTALGYTWERVARQTAEFYERLRAMS